jgi:hypothetical protein
VRSIDDTPRALHAILDDWREAEREVAAAAGADQQAGARERADAFREEYRRAFEDTLRRSEIGGGN